jgi:prepilin-type N-terminal cleavage/methylation domain-containing protein
MSHKLREKYQGFTIIEVMIVLAIAAIILLAIFLAVPALQRNSRNTQRKSDVASVLAAINEYSANQNGSPPAVLCLVGNTLTVAGGSCAVPTGAVTANLSGQFTSVTLAAWSAGQVTAANVLKVYTAATCNGNLLATGSGRSVAAFFQVEPAVDQCTSS